MKLTHQQLHVIIHMNVKQKYTSLKKLVQLHYVYQQFL